MSVNTFSEWLHLDGELSFLCACERNGISFAKAEAHDATLVFMGFSGGNCCGSISQRACGSYDAFDPRSESAFSCHLAENASHPSKVNVFSSRSLGQQELTQSPFISQCPVIILNHFDEAFFSNANFVIG